MIPYSKALTLMRSNGRAVWSPKGKEEDHTGFAASRIHDGYADIAAPKPFRFRKGQRFFCVGSCFAREIEDAITAEGSASETRDRSLALVATRPDLFARTPNVAGRPNAFLNRYNSASMALMMEDIAAGTLGENLLFGRTEQKIDLHYTRFIQPLPQGLAMERRKLLREMYSDALAASDVFIFTLGLCEAFQDIDEHAYLNVTPDPRTAAGRTLEFRFLDLGDNVNCLKSIVRNLRSIRPNAEIVLTVSPVPLDVTFTDMDVVVANSLAKSTLVSAAHAMAVEDDGCYYFPSYEMVTSSSQEHAWQWDKKHVAPGMVSHIMKSFISRHMT